MSRDLAPATGEPTAGGDAGPADPHAAVAPFSPFLARLAADPARVERLAAAPRDEVLRGVVAAQHAVGPRMASGAIGQAEAMAELRRHRADIALLVALADLEGAWGLEAVTEALTAFADASVESAVAIALADAARAGALTSGAPEGSGLVVLALGKHGAGELNYSSDIDLVIFFDPAAPARVPSAEPARLYTRVAQLLVRLLGERTVDGYVHRVDLRLRPDPASTRAAVSLPAAYAYYETVGQNWERAAMIKARPVAGDRALGQRFLDDLRPFVWRKYFDFAAVADIHAMKRQIHAVRDVGDPGLAGYDVKLGRGGIREIEFFVQTQQLVFGGRRPALRGRRTLDMLSRLAADGWVTAEAEHDLAAAYRFLRTVEHRLQMVADEQTQRLPRQDADLDALARFCGFPDLPGFTLELTRHAARVRHHYGLLFEAGEDLAAETGDLVFTGAEVDAATLATLCGMGFRDPAKAAETVRGWHFGRRPAVTSARAREVLTDLVPSLLAALGGTADPDGALARLDDAFGRMPAAVELLTLLRSRARLRQLFADLLGTAPRLADTVAAAPHVLDSVLDPGFARPVAGDDAAEAELREILGEPTSTEEFLDRVRDAARQIRFVTGARMLSGILTPREGGAAFAALARAVVRAALDHVSAAFSAEHGSVPGARIAVLGLGRLGAGDLTAASDLDLVVLYTFDEGRRTSDGPRPLDAVVYHTRLTQRLVSALTVPTRRGRLYEVDLRLRPSGTQGPVASQFGGFLSYHADEAELWEHMALTRARVLAGDPVFGGRVSDAVAGILSRPRDPRVVYPAVAAMRDRVAEAKPDGGPWDLKLAPGGLLDLDFLAQALVLAGAHAHPGLVGLSTGDVLAKAGRLGLLPVADAASLSDTASALDALHHWRRLTLRDDVGPDRSPSLARRLAHLSGSPDAPGLLAEIGERRAAVRASFDRVLRR